MLYLVASGLRSADLPQGCRVVADGEAVSLEQPWSFGAPLIAQVDDGADLDALKSKPGVTAFTVEGQLPPGAGKAFAIGAHKMRDAEAFKPYIARVPDVIAPYGCRYIARGGKVDAALRRVHARPAGADGIPQRRRRGGVLFFRRLCAAVAHPAHGDRAALCRHGAFRRAAAIGRPRHCQRLGKV